MARNSNTKASERNYEAFVDKFNPKKTTDDCYTPPIVYEALAEWVSAEYNIDRKNFVRPFFPGGDFEGYDYGTDDVVVDNPPFSILSKICEFYNERGIKYFLFAPSLTLFSSSSSSRCNIVCGVDVEYENGAKVPTSFVTNLEDTLIRTAPDLYQIVSEANLKNIRQNARPELPKYDFPDNMIYAPMLIYLSKHGQELKIKKNQAHRISRLDAQKDQKTPSGKSSRAVFGGGFLVNNTIWKDYEQAQAQAQAQGQKTYVYKLSEREKKIIKELDENV